MYDRLQEADIPSKMITLEGIGHNIFRNGLILADPYFDDITTFLYENVTKGGQAPEGCSLIE